MPTFKVSAKAEADLYDIGLYTQNKFGIKQRNRYLDEIVEKFQVLAKQPKLGQNRSTLKTECYSSLINSHVIFFQRHSYGIRIIRVLHQSMDLPKHLQPS